MGLVYANIKLSNPVLPEQLPIEVNCLVDSGATFLCIPQHVAVQLGLNEKQKREIILADETAKLVPYVGPVKIEFENRACYAGALVADGECLLGTIPMAEMDLVVHSGYFKLSVNPESHSIARGLAN